LALAVVRDLRELRSPANEDDITALETDLMSEFVLARYSAGLTDVTIRSDASNLELIRSWFGRPLWEMKPTDADEYFGKEMRHASPATRANRSGALAVYFEFLELRHKAQLHQRTGVVVECPLDEMNRPRVSFDPKIRVPPSEAEMEQLFRGWRERLLTCRKFAPAARNYAAARLCADVGLRINEARMLDLDDVRWDLGTFGKLNVRYGKGARRKGPKQRLVPLINGSDQVLRWFIEDVWGMFGYDHTLPDAPLFPSERKNTTGRPVTTRFRAALAEAVAEHLPSWTGNLTPHVLRHYCASQLYANGVDLLAIQELLGHTWVATTMRYVYVQSTRLEEAVARGQQHASDRWKGLVR